MKPFVKKSLVAGLACAALVGIAVAQNYGPGMMGGYGGPGMMGPGMMGGYGGGGMMGGSGMMGPGMMGGYGYAGINLTPDQQSKMLEIQKKLDQQRWDLMGKMHQQGYQGMHAYKDGKFDEAGARRQFDVMTGFHKQMFEIMIRGQKEMDALLTPDQRKQLQQPWGRR
ncbi:MAG: Spy/CpxP family protein refolding chaperone [Burkholderiales bacterium]